MKIVYQGRKIDESDETIVTCQMMFDEYSKNEVLSSIKRLVKKSKYVPSIHEIIEEVEKSFTVEKMVKNDCIVNHVQLHDQLIPFKFKTKDEATYEKMSAYAYITILETILKLVIVYLLVIGNIDKLILYSILMFLVSLIIRITYQVYCTKKFREVRFKFVIDKHILKQMFSYAFWSLLRIHVRAMDRDV